MHCTGSDLNLSEPCKLKASEEGLSVVQSGGPWACRVSESYMEGAAGLTQVVRIHGEVISCWPQLGPSGTIPSQWQLLPLLPASLLFARVKTQVRLQAGRASSRTPYWMPEGCMVVPYCAAMPP